MAGVGQTLLVTWGVRGLHVNAYATVCCRLASWHGTRATAAAAGAFCPGVSHGTLQTDDLVPVCVFALHKLGEGSRSWSTHPNNNQPAG